MIQTVESKLREAWPPADWSELTVVVGVSGGGDSVALLRALAAIRLPGAGQLCVAHLNHQLRPEADEDEQFVVALCGRLGLPCEVGRVAVNRLAETSGDGIEAAARSARYSFLQEVAQRVGARFIVTAHTADDQAETILHRIVRGTGIRGLGGMARARRLGHATLIRPLLEFRREELIAYLDALGQAYCRDRSNLDLRFTRNRIRHSIMPQLREQFNPEATEALLRLGALATEAQAVIDAMVEEWFARCVSIESPHRVRIDLSGFCDRPRYLIRELFHALWRRQGWHLQAMGRRKWEELSELALGTDARRRRVFPGEIEAVSAENILHLTQNLRSAAIRG